eukprot:1098581-Lingulodinium_polyedra.AAC.1
MDNPIALAADHPGPLGPLARGSGRPAPAESLAQTPRHLATRAPGATRVDKLAATLQGPGVGVTAGPD